MHRIIFSMGPITVYTYGFFVALGVAVSVIMAVNQAGKEGVKASDMLDILTAIIIGALLGGRALFVVLNLGSYLSRPAAIFDLSEGGMAFQGALILGLLFGAGLSAKRGISFWKISDILAPYLALAHSMGRIGCFFNGCCYGLPTNCYMSVTFPGESIQRIPVQLYSSAGLLGIFVILLRLRRKKTFDGYLFAAYLMAYGIFRIFMDNFRGDELVRVYGFTLAQVISAGIFIAGVVIYAFRKGQKLSGKKT
ncbi:MAG: prolipoprotein diacylglyceryl transferase [Candidatus Omnitrophota bacterium]